MAFSKEDRRKVSDFFQKILQEVEQPIYYEYLRGHINKADSVVKNYVLKKCKGEELLKYFQKRKNYFIVDFRNEVSLKSKPNFLSTSSFAAQGGHTSEIISEPDNSFCSENSDIELLSISRSNSMSSMYESANSENEEYSNQVDDMIEESLKYKKLTLNYFRDILRNNEKLNLNTIEIQSLPKKVKYYITRHLKSLIISFFNDNPDTFRIDRKGFITLVNTPFVSAESFQNIHPRKDTLNDEREEESFAQVEENESITDYLQCIEFFAGLLKKRSLPLKTLSGKLSQAPPNVKEYLNANYETFKLFLIKADKLFTVKNDEVSLCKDSFKLLKRARKLLSLKCDAEFTSQSIKNVFHSLFQNESHTARSSSTFEQEETNYSDTCKEMLSAVNTHAKSFVQILEEANKLDDERFKASKNLEEQKLHENAVNEESIYHEAPLEKVTKKDVGNSTDILSNEDVQLEYFACDNTGEAHESLHQPVESLFDKAKRNSEINFIECIFIAHLLCLEVHEKCHILRLKCGHEAVKHFVEILERLPGKTSDLNSLKGSLGQASSETIFFMKQLYKNEKFKLFFVEHKEFTIDSNCMLVKLSSTYKDRLEDREKIHEDFVAGGKMYDVHTLYNSDLHETFVDVIDCLSKICCFLQNKSKAKLSRLNGILSSKFSTSQLDFINTLSGSAVAEKFKKFLHYFAFFDISDEYVEMDSQNMDISFFVNHISRFSEKLQLVMKYEESKLPCFDYLLDHLEILEKEKSSISFSDLKKNVIDKVNSVMSYLDYSDLPKIVGYEIILMVLLEKKDSRILIQLLEESNLFKLENGQIFLKDSEENKSFENVKESSETVSSQNLNDNVEDLKSVAPALNSFCEIASNKNDGNKLGTEMNTISAKDIENEELNENAFCKNTSCESNKATSLPHSNVQEDEICEKEEIENDISNYQKSLKNTIFVNNSENSSQTFHDNNIKSNECALFKKHKETVSDKLLRKLPVSDSGYDEFVSSNLPSSPSSILMKSTCENELKFEQKSKKDFNERNILKPHSANVLENTSEVKLGEMPSVLSLSYMDKGKQISDITEGNSETPFVKRSISENFDIECENNVFEINQQEQFNINSACNESEENLPLSSEKHHTAVDEQNPSKFKNEVHQYEDGYGVRKLASESDSDSEDKENKEYADHRSVINRGNQFSALSKNVHSFCLNNIEDSRSLKHAKKLIKGSVCPENISKENVVDIPHHEDISEGKAVDKNMNEVTDGNSNTSNKMPSCTEETSNITEDFVLTKSACFGSEKFNSEIKQNKVLKNNNDHSLDNHNVSESFTPRKISSITEAYDSGHNFGPSFLQPLLAKVILITLDSCIVETVVSGCKKYVFCLKSSFHCDKHSNCLDCFGALTIGDEVSCYVPPDEKFQCGNMCFSFMFCKESKLENTNSMQPEDFFRSQSYINEKLNKRCDHTLANTEFSKHLDKTDIESQSVKCLNDCINEEKPHSLVIKKELNKCSIVSQHTQTVNSPQDMYFGVEKECQVKFATVSQDTQTLYQMLNNECQTDMIEARPPVSNKASQTECLTLKTLTFNTECQTDFNIKICPVVCDKSSITNYSTLSASTQTVSKLFENECQTDISGNIKSQFDVCNVSCQTECSEHMREHSSFRDEYCQTYLVASEINVPAAENDAASEMKSRFVSKLSTASCVAEVDSSQSSPCIFPQKEFCNTACQTISTGDIWIKNYMV